MSRLPAAIPLLAATALFGAPAFAHHSQASYDTSREVLIEGTVARLDWKNPHMYLIVETQGEDGAPQLVQVEGLAITQALVNGLHEEDLPPGAHVVVRANPNRGGPGKTVRGIDVTTEDGEIHPFYAENTQSPTLTRAESLEGTWAPSLQATTAAMGAAGRWPITAAGRAIQAEARADGLCYVEPTPFLAILDEPRTIELGDKEVVFHYDNSGDEAVRVVRIDAEHPADVKPSRFGDAIGWWEGKTLVIDTVAFEPNPSGLFVNVPSSAGKHTVERLTLTDDQLRLHYESTVEDPVYLEEPVTFSMLWDHRPDLELSPPDQACDDKVAHRYLEE
jgi:hypothetical protein